MSAARVTKVPLVLRLAETLGPLLIRALGSTWRVEIRPRGVEEARRRRGERVIYAFWHGRMLVPAYTHRGQGIAILISRHRDGEYIARPVARLGFKPVRGSTTRGGAAALRESLRRANAGNCHLAFTPDGPRGPRYRVQPGVIWAASRTGLPIVPAAVEAERAWVLGSWDEFTIPKPFSRVTILEGAPIPIPPDLTPAALEHHRLALEETLEALRHDI